MNDHDDNDEPAFHSHTGHTWGSNTDQYERNKTKTGRPSGGDKLPIVACTYDEGPLCSASRLSGCDLAYLMAFCIQHVKLESGCISSHLHGHSKADDIGQLMKPNRYREM